MKTNNNKKKRKEKKQKDGGIGYAVNDRKFFVFFFVAH